MSRGSAIKSKPYAGMRAFSFASISAWNPVLAPVLALCLFGATAARAQEAQSAEMSPQSGLAASQAVDIDSDGPAGDGFKLRPAFRLAQADTARSSETKDAASIVEGVGLSVRPSRELLAQTAAAAAKPNDSNVTRHSEEPSPSGFGRFKNYTVPALEIVGFDALLNLFNRNFLKDKDDYASNLNTIRRNLKDSWVVDNDPYQVNQIGHPYQGSMYHGFARSAGLSYWESAAYTFAGSAFWEIAGERTRPSFNDQIATGIGGSFFGEALFRMASLVLERGGGLSPYWREWVAAAISPSLGFNRHFMGYDTIFSSNGAPYYSRLAIGASGQTQSDPGTSSRVRKAEGLLDFALDYGMPGKSGYLYNRPFDYFAVQATASTANVLENVLVRGMLIGKTYERGERLRGIWGLYGSFDYIAPQTFRVSSTALSLGTTAQAWLTPNIALQGTAMAGAGYAAVGTINGTNDGDFRYGVTPQALVALRLIYGDKASIDFTGREYFVTRAGGSTAGHDNIARADLAFTWRIVRQHAVSLRFLWNRRDASYTTLGDRVQKSSTVGIYYTLLGSDRFGAFDWR